MIVSLRRNAQISLVSIREAMRTTPGKYPFLIVGSTIDNQGNHGILQEKREEQKEKRKRSHSTPNPIQHDVLTVEWTQLTDNKNRTIRSRNLQKGQREKENFILKKYTVDSNRNDISNLDSISPTFS